MQRSEEPPYSGAHLLKWADAYRASRVDVAGETAKEHRVSHLKAMTRRSRIATRSDHVGDVQGGRRQNLGRRLRRYVKRCGRSSTSPTPSRNPAGSRGPPPTRGARDRRSAVSGDVDTIIATVPARWRLPLRVLEQTGMRVGELHALEWGDVDEAGLRFRVRRARPPRPAAGSRSRNG